MFHPSVRIDLPVWKSTPSTQLHIPPPASVNQMPWGARKQTIGCCTAQSLKTNRYVLTQFLAAPTSRPHSSSVRRSTSAIDEAKTCLLNTRNLTIKQFTDLLVAKKHDRYRFDTSGQGCRYWVTQVIKLLETGDHISDTREVVAAKTALEIVWANGGIQASVAEQSPIIQGEFFALERSIHQDAVITAIKSRKDQAV